MSAECWLVKLEFGRVQTYLFAVSELKSMIGANALLGEVLRGQLLNGAFAPGQDTLPALARTCRAQLPVDDVNVAKLELPSPLEGDPLAIDDCDDPQATFRQGVLARDGGHFHAVFKNLEEAQTFIVRARDLVGRRLPGLIVKARVLPLTCSDQGVWTEGQEIAEDSPRADELFDLPVFQVCEIAGQGPAAAPYREPANNGDVLISESVHAKRMQATRFDMGRSRDILGLIRPKLLKELNLDSSGLSESQRLRIFPQQFEEVAEDSGYLAVIAADGNGIGSRSSVWRGDSSKDYFAREARGETFFHRMRGTVRIALVKALAITFRRPAEQIVQKQRSRLPFRLMMVGGDDLLLVCDAAYALRFVVDYVECLEQLEQADEASLHVGVGVAIVKKKFPFHRAHALAEQLAASAKRFYRSLPKEQRCSTVDWLAISEAWHEEVADVRRRDAVVRYLGPNSKEETLVLSRRPYRVRGVDSLEKLLLTAKQVVGKLPRNQLAALAEELQTGKRQADRAVRQLPDEARRHLGDLVNGPPDDCSVWRKHGEDCWSTAILDFLEVYELERLLHLNEQADQKQFPTTREKGS